LTERKGNDRTQAEISTGIHEGTHMNIAFLKGEKTIAEVVARIYPGSSRAPAKRKQATDALLAANPQLADLSKVEPGAKIVVPAISLPHDPAETTQVTSSAPAGRNNVFLYQHLDSLKTVIPAAANTTVASANATIALLQRAEVQAAAAKDPNLAQRVAAATQSANARIQAAQTLETQYLQSIGPLQALLVKQVKP
jgi:phage tail protein X